MAGWIKLHRDMAQHWLWDDKPFSRGQAWIDLLLWARHKPGKASIEGSLFSLDVGQQARSVVTLAKHWGWERRRVQRFLNSLSADGMIVQQTNNRTSIITICNYLEFQGDGKTAKGVDGTADEHQTVQQPDIKRYTIEEGEEGKKGNNNPTPEDSGESSATKCPHSDILSAWAEALPGKRQPRRNMWKPDRKEYKHLAARWKEMLNTKHSETGEPLYTTREEGIAWWRAFFTHISKSPFLMEDHRWFDIKWVVNKTNFYKIIEGNYH